MSQSDLYREVARATGETVNRIKQMGFSLLVVPPTTDLTSRAGRQRAHFLARQQQASVSSGKVPVVA
jgi:hypothetical protein